MALHNKLDRNELRKQLEADPQKRQTLSFYKYARIGNPELFRDHLYIHFSEAEVLGRIYVANEGINAQISIPLAQHDLFQEKLNEITFLQGVRLNWAIEDDGKSFLKLKVKVREKIVADGLNDSDFDSSAGGKHLSAEEFNALTENPQTIVVDMRNHYESEVGHFQNAITPDVDTFREALDVVEDELSDKKDHPIIMYCTGGIRCEKASAYYRYKGFQEVYQLDGGIIEYARQVNEKGLENKYVGKNFVFDERLGERISDEVISVCHQCGETCDTHTNCVNEACHLLFIQCSSCAEKMEACCSEECKEVNRLPIEEQRELRRGTPTEMRIYRKGRSQKLAYKK